MCWKKADSTGLVLFPFNSTSKYQLSLNRGDIVKICGEKSQWYKGYLDNAPEQKGVFPQNHVEIVKEIPKKIDQHIISKYNQSAENNSEQKKKSEPKHTVLTEEELVAARKDPLAEEILQVLKEWGGELRKLLEDQRVAEYEQIKKQMSTLVDYRKQLMTTSPEDNAKRKEIQRKVINIIEEGSRLLNIDVIVRVPSGKNKGERANEQNTPVVELYRMYRAVQDKEEEKQQKLKRLEEQRKSSKKNIQQQRRRGRRNVDDSNHLSNQNTNNNNNNNNNLDPYNNNNNNNSNESNTHSHYNQNNNNNNQNNMNSDIISNKKKDSEEDALFMVPDFSQLVVDIEACIFSVREPTDVCFSLFSAKERDYISEEFSIEFTEAGMPYDQSLIGNMTTVFKDLSRKDFARDLFLVVRIFRRGKIQLSSSDRMPPNSKRLPEMSKGYKRPFGCSVFHLTIPVLEKLSTSFEYKPGKLSIYDASKEELFPFIPDLFAKKNFRDVRLLPQAQAIGIPATIRLLPQTFSEAKQENQKIGKLNPVQLLQYPEVVSPSDRRHDFYLHMVSGSFSDAKNTEVRVRVYVDKKPEPCLTRYVQSERTDPGEAVRSSVLANISKPNFRETIRINLPPEKLEKAWLVFSYGNCSHSKDNDVEIKGMGVLPLSDNSGVFLDDQRHTVPMYKTSKDSELFNIMNDETLRQKHSTKNFIAVRTKLISTIMAQNPIINNLIKWRTQPQSDLSDILSQLQYAEDAEVARYLREVVNALFDIMSSSSSNRDEAVSKQVFEALQKIVEDILKSQRNPEKLQQSLTEYIQDHFNSPTAFRWLVDELLQNLGQLDDRHANKLNSTLRCLSVFVEMIVRSFREFKENSSNYKAQDLEQLKNKLNQVMSRIKDLLQKEPTTNIAAAQSLLLKYMRTFFDSLSEIYDEKELGNIVLDFLNSIKDSVSAARNNFSRNKLSAIRQIVKGQVFAKTGSRNIVLPKIFQQLKHHFNNTPPERLLCIEIVCDMLLMLQKTAEYQPQQQTDHFLRQVLQLLPSIFEAMKSLKEEVATKNMQIEKAQENMRKPNIAEGQYNTHKEELKEYRKARHEAWAAQPDLVASVLCMFYLVNQDMLNEYLESKEVEDREKYAMQLFELQLMLLEDNPFPEHWVSFNAFMFSVVMRFIQMSGQYLVEHFLLSTRFSFDLWHALFRLCSEFILNRNLQLEQLPTSKQNKLVVNPSNNNATSTNPIASTNSSSSSSSLKSKSKSKSNNNSGNNSNNNNNNNKKNSDGDDDDGDMRVTVVKYFFSLWSKLGDLQSRFIPDIVEEVLSLMIIPKHAISAVAMEMYFSVLKREFLADHTLRKCQGVTATVIDDLVIRGYFDRPEFRDMFLGGLEERFHADTKMKDEGQVFIADLQQLITLVTAVQKYNDSEEDNKTAACLKVMAYLTDNRSKTLYFKYVHTLASMHLSLRNFAEAGMTVLLHARSLEWDVAKELPAFSEAFPAETEFRRKERLLANAIDYFLQGQDWERSIELSKALVDKYESVTFEYKRLGGLLEKQGKAYCDIVDVKRFFPSYFYVAFYGKGFAEVGLQDKRFIYKGDEAERNVDFMNRIKKQFPNAEMLKSREANPSSEITEGEGQYIQIMTATPSSSIEIEQGGFTRPRQGAEPFRKYHYDRHNNINWFFYTRTYRTNKDHTENEHKDMHTDMYFFATEKAFPTIQRRIEIVDKKVVTLRPLENAIKTVEDKNLEFEELIIDHKEGRPDVNKLSMLLNGVIDAAVNGGISKYIDAFFNEEYIENHPDDIHLLSRFQRAMAHQVDVLNDALIQRRLYATGKALDLSDYLEGLYDSMKNQLKEPLNKVFE